MLNKAHYIFNQFAKGYISTKILKNRGKLRSILSKKITKIVQSQLENVRNGKIDLPKRGTSNIPISLTSYPPRFESLPLVLLNLLNQKQLPSKIIVWLTTTDNKLLDPGLKAIFENSLVEFRLTKDYGPHKKWLPFVLDNNDPFVICDDDIYYPDDWFESLLLSDDNKSYVGHRCHQMQLSSNGEILPYKDWKKGVHLLDDPSFDLFIVGCGGAIIYPNRINKKFRDWDLISRLSPKADDVWLKFAHNATGIPVKKSNYFFPCIEYAGSQFVSLTESNVNHGANDKQIQNILKNMNSPILPTA